MWMGMWMEGEELTWENSVACSVIDTPGSLLLNEWRHQGKEFCDLITHQAIIHLIHKQVVLCLHHNKKKITK